MTLAGKRRWWLAAVATVVGGVGCSSGDTSSVETWVPIPPTSSAVVETIAPPDFGGPTLSELPELQPVERFTVEHASADEPVFVSEEGLWFIGVGDTDEGTGWRLWRTNGEYHQSDAVLLPVGEARADDAIVVDGVLWVPARDATKPDGVELANAMLRVDLADGTTDVFPAPGDLDRLEADGSTVWAEVIGSEVSTIVGFDETGPVGPAFEVGEAAREDGLRAILLPTRGGVYDCFVGAWGFTDPAGKRVDVPISNRGCNAVAVDPGFVIGVPGGLRLLGIDGTVREVALPSELMALGARVDLSCNGPAQRGDQVVVLCGQLAATTFEVQIDLDTMSATFEPSLGIQELGTRRFEHVLGASRRYGSIEIDRGLSAVGAIVADLTAAGTLTWTHVDFDDIGGGSKALET